MNMNGWVRDAIVVAVSVAGSAAITYRVTRNTSNPSVIRSSRIELLDGAGKVGAILDADNGEGGAPQPRIRFIDRDGRSRAELGLRFQAQCPYLLIAGDDKRPRISIGVDQYGNPALNMSDHEWDGRLLLGAMPSDVAVAGPVQDWGLYVNPSNRRNNASVWVSGEWYSGKERAGIGFVSAEDRVVRRRP